MRTITIFVKQDEYKNFLVMYKEGPCAPLSEELWYCLPWNRNRPLTYERLHNDILKAFHYEIPAEFQSRKWSMFPHGRALVSAPSAAWGRCKYISFEIPDSPLTLWTEQFMITASCAVYDDYITGIKDGKEHIFMASRYENGELSDWYDILVKSSSSLNIERQ